MAEEDPDRLLGSLRRAVADAALMARDEGVELELLREASFHFARLDDWLRGGGDLPGDWVRRRLWVVPPQG